MEQRSVGTPRVATVAEAATVATSLDAFNREYRTPTPGPAVLAIRLRRLLAGTEVIALLAGDPAVAVALLTLRPTCGTRVRSLFSTSFMLRRSCAARHGYTSTEPGPRPTAPLLLPGTDRRPVLGRRSSGRPAERSSTGTRRSHPRWRQAARGSRHNGSGNPTR
jgi:hypothetical protein